MTSSIFTLAKIKKFIKHDGTFRKGNKHYKANHILLELHDVEQKFLKAKCQASMKKIYRNVQIYYEKGFSCNCDCPKGLHQCSHMAAVLIFLHHNVSCTDLENSWLRRHPKTVPDRQLPPTDALFPSRQPEYSCTDFRPSSRVINTVGRILDADSYTNYGWFLSREPVAVVSERENQCQKYSRLGLLQYIISKQHNSNEDLYKNMLDNIKLNQEEIIEIAKLTESQGNSSADKFWYELRKFRPTGSTFRNFLTASHSNKMNKTLYQKVSEVKDLSGIHQIKHGRDNEKVAIKKFEEESNIKTEATGIWIEERGLFAASPDALIPGLNACLEVKCPWKFRNSLLDEVLSVDNSYILSKEENGWSLNYDHEYYHQYNLKCTAPKAVNVI